MAAVEALVKRDENGLAERVPLTPSPIFRGEQMVRSLQDYRELQKALDETMPDQLMTLDGRPFRKKGYWRAIAVAFNLTVEPITNPQSERSVIGHFEDGGENYVYTVAYKATAPNGRAAVGDGTCAASEKQRGRMKATEHNVRSHAHTRAFNRSVSNLVGFGEVSAEEIEHDDSRGDTAPMRSDGATKITAIDKSTGTNKQTGKSWTKYTVTFADGRSAGTFDFTVMERAFAAKERDAFVVPVIQSNGRFSNLTGLDAPAADPDSAEARAEAETLFPIEAPPDQAIAQQQDERGADDPEQHREFYRAKIAEYVKRDKITTSEAAAIKDFHFGAADADLAAVKIVALKNLYEGWDGHIKAMRQHAPRAK